MLKVNKNIFALIFSNIFNIVLCIEHNLRKRCLRLLLGCSSDCWIHSVLFPVPGKDLVIRKYILVSLFFAYCNIFQFHKYLIEKGPN